MPNAEGSSGFVSEQIARRYISASNRCDYEEMASLFHEDAEWVPISPMEPRRGREAIRERYLVEVKPQNAPIVNDVYTADEHRCVVEFEVDHPERGLVPIVDVFTVNAAGEIRRLAVYRRQRTSVMSQATPDPTGRARPSRDSRRSFLRRHGPSYPAAP